MPLALNTGCSKDRQTCLPVKDNWMLRTAQSSKAQWSAAFHQPCSAPARRGQQRNTTELPQHSQLPGTYQPFPTRVQGCLCCRLSVVHPSLRATGWLLKGVHPCLQLSSGGRERTVANFRGGQRPHCPHYGRLRLQFSRRCTQALGHRDNAFLTG